MFCLVIVKPILHQLALFCFASPLLTVYSFVDLAKEILSEPGVRYFLSEKLCQDPLEEQFSKQRSAGGGNRNMTVKDYASQELRILTAGSQMVASAKGNSRNRKRRSDEDLPLPKAKS